jgi:aminopeptidase N
VRREVASSLGAVYEDGARDALLRLSREEKNPDVLAAIIGALMSWPDWDAAEYLARSSYRQRVASAAITALRARDDQSRAADILARLRDSAVEFESDDYGAGLDALAFVSRRQENKDSVRTFLAGHLTHPRESYRQAAAKALGTLGDTRGVALLRPLTAERKPFKDPVRETAEKSIQQIESLQTGPPELKNVWQRLQELQKKAEDLESQLEKLQKKVTPEKP